MMRDFINIIERGLLLIESIHLAPFERLAQQYPDVNQFINKTDGQDALYRGHGGHAAVVDHSFFTDYLGHAGQYGDFIDAFAYDPQDVMMFDDQRFEEMRSFYRRASEWEPENLADLYCNSLVGNRFRNELNDQIERVVEVILSDEDISYSSFCSNYEENDAFIPLMQSYAASKGKNIIAFRGGDYDGDQTEYVVGDVSILVNLRDLHARIQNDSGI